MGREKKVAKQVKRRFKQNDMRTVIAVIVTDLMASCLTKKLKKKDNPYLVVKKELDMMVSAAMGE